MNAKRPLVPRPRLKGTLLAAAIFAVGSVSACGSSPSAAPVASSPASVASPTSAALPSAATPTTAAGQSESAPVAAGDDCGGAVARVTKATASFTQITKITTVAGCGEVSIATNLASGVLGSPSTTAGVKICTAAAAVAYQGDVTSVTVVATDGHELAIAVKGQDCIP